MSLAAARASNLYASPIIFDSAAKVDPRCPMVGGVDELLNKASNALQQTKYSAAVEILQPVAALDCDSRVALFLAAAFEGSGNLSEARQTLQHARGVWPANTSLATSLAREYLKDGMVKEAAATLQGFQATSQTPWNEMQLSVMVYLASHQLDKAKTLAELGWQTYPSLQSLLLFANSLQLEGRYKDVIALLGNQRSSYQNFAPFLVTLAESEFDAAMYDVARADSKRAVSLDGKLYAAHYLLGNILLKLGDPEPAAAEYRVALALEPAQPRTYYYLALALRALHNEKDEESILAKAIVLDDHYALAHCEMGRILLNGNRLSDAIAQLNLAVEDNASSEQAYYLLSRAYDRLGDKDQAAAMAKRLAEVRRENHSGSLPQTQPSSN